MNMELLVGLGLAVLVAVALGVWRARRRAAAPPPAEPLRAPPPTSRPVAAAAESPLGAQRQAAAEALRQARQRKADEAARLEAERQSAQRQAHADAEALAQARQRARPTPPAPSAPAPSSAPDPLPLPAAAPLPGAAPWLPPEPAAPSAGSPDRTPMVVLADDSKVVRVKTGRLLERQGWRVLLVEDGLSALAALESGAAQLLITDVEMPGLDGFELTRRLRAQPRLAHLPVIMITSSDTRHRPEADAAGVNLLLGKPYSEEALVAEARALMDLSAAQPAAPLAWH